MAALVEVPRGCCISHDFLRAVLNAPHKEALVYAEGGARVQAVSKIVDVNSHEADEVHGGVVNVFEGDTCLTYSEVMSAVESLSRRIRCILDGGDDPHLMRPKGTALMDESSTTHGIEFPKYFISGTTEHPVKSHSTVMPKIIGVYIGPSIEYIVTVLSVLRCGEAFLPLDPSWPRARICSVVSSSGTDLIITGRCSCQKECTHLLDISACFWTCAKCPLLPITTKECLEQYCDTSHTHLPWPCGGQSQRSFCYLIYTSGSTGKPKGVCGTENGLLNRLWWMEDTYPSHGKDILLFKTSTSFIDHLQEIFGAVLTSCTLVIPPHEDLRKNLYAIIHYMEVYSINRLIAVPSLMREIVSPSDRNVCAQIRKCLKILVLSGEILNLSLWKILVKLLPETCILNLYGSAEVSGDCLYFDCEQLPKILDATSLDSVPIGIPIRNCDILLVDDHGIAGHGEVYVGGVCLAIGYASDHVSFAKDFVKLPDGLLGINPDSECIEKTYFRTGDHAMRLQTGDFVFIGRKDRTLKINGQKICLEEIESMLRQHADIEDAAVISCKRKDDNFSLGAFIIKHASSKLSSSSIRSWMIRSLPSAMIPLKFFFVSSFPVTFTGKIDYVQLEECMHFVVNDPKHSSLQDNISMDSIKKAFCDALTVEVVSDDDDFFHLGGNSLAAAHASHDLNISMRLLYTFSTPAELLRVLQDLQNISKNRSVSSADKKRRDTIALPSKSSGIRKKLSTSAIRSLWDSEEFSWSASCLFSRCNRVLCEGEYAVNDVCQSGSTLSPNGKGRLRELWRVHMDSCVDASPTILFRNGGSFLFIGSHSKALACVNPRSGCVVWRADLEGKIECPASVVKEFSLVVVGCCSGNIYFLDYLTGSVCWVFKTHAEVKSPAVDDMKRQVVWCPSYDGHIYALDYSNFTCVHVFPSHGSVYGSPVIDTVNEILYAATTSGRLMAFSLKDSLFHLLWENRTASPVFASLSMIPSSGNVVCCTVDGHVVATDSAGRVIWKTKAEGPLFSGPCISHAFPSHAVLCSRSGAVYALELENGRVVWEYRVGEPITASAYVDENLILPPLSSLPDRLLCVCTSSGRVEVLRVDGEMKHVEDFALLHLPADVFSSPLMIDARLFVGCRDDYLHCLLLHTHDQIEVS